jgi:hypothetical protein
VTPWAVRLATSAVRTWTLIYTWQSPEPIRIARCEQIDSDLWEHIHDADPRRQAGLALQIIGRLLAGVPDDLGWRIETEPVTGMRRLRVAMTIGAAGMLVFWLAVIAWSSAPPPLPEAPRFRPEDIAGPPPPPPPPPCAPPGFTDGSRPGCSR